MKPHRLRSALTAFLLLLAAAAVGLLLPPLLARQAEPHGSELGIYEMEQIRLANDQDLNLPELVERLNTYSHSFALEQGLLLDTDAVSASAASFAADLIRLGILPDVSFTPAFTPAPTLLVWNDGRTQIDWESMITHQQTQEFPFVSLAQSIDDSSGALLSFSVSREWIDAAETDHVWPFPAAYYAQAGGLETEEPDESAMSEQLDALAQRLADCFRDRNALAECTVRRLDTSLETFFYECTWEIRLSDSAGHTASLTLSITPHEILWNPC